MSRPLYLRITNLNKQTVRDRFADVPYVFAPDQPIDIPEDAAEHIFGSKLTEKGFADPEASFLHLARRWGLVHARDKADPRLMERARKLYDNLRFEVLRMELQAVKLSGPIVIEDDEETEAMGPGG